MESLCDYAQEEIGLYFLVNGTSCNYNPNDKKAQGEFFMCMLHVSDVCNMGFYLLKQK